jgi:allantoinase
LREGLISCVVSDHSPAPPDLKAVDTGDFGTAWGGISGLQTQLPVVWTEARQRGFGLADLARVQSAAPAALAGLPSKGAIAVGRDADLVAWDPDASFVLEAADLHYRHRQSPWSGRELFGVVDTVWLSGRELADGGAPGGRLLRRGVA